MSTVSNTRMTEVAIPGGSTPDAISRKKRSERILVSEGVPFRSDLPLFPFSGNTRPRSKNEVACRALCVLMTAMKAERMDQTMALRVIRQYGLAAHFSPREKDFIRNAAPAAHEMTAFLWRYEAAWVLLWALGYIGGLSTPNRTCDVDRAVICMRDRNTRSFENDASLRPLAQLLDQADLTYRYHASMTDSEQDQRINPGELNANVVYQRRLALSWLIRYPDKEWDDINTDR